LKSIGAPSTLRSFFWSGETLRSRNVSAMVLSGRVAVPALPARLVADCDQEIAGQLDLAPGEVEALALARARVRWPAYRQCLQMLSDWLQARGLPTVLACSDPALMACRSVRYHHDGTHYGGAAFCNLFLSEDCGLDLHFPSADCRVPLSRGTVVIFDTGQAHALVERSSGKLYRADGDPAPAQTQLFLSWELPIEHAEVQRALHIALDVDPLTASRLDQAQVWLNGAPASVCPESGQWLGSGGG
jgi:hypothetical protein